MAHASRNHAARALTALCLGAVGTTILTTAPAYAEPSVDQAQSTVDKVSHDRDTVARKARTTEKDLVKARHLLARARADLSTSRVALTELQRRAEALQPTPVDEDGTIGRALTAAAQVTTAPDPAEALDDVQDELEVPTEAPATESLQDRVDVLEERVEDQTSRVRTLLARDRATDKHLRQVKASLARAYATLEEAEDAEAEKAEQAVASSGAAAAVDYAMAQVGDAYVYGAAGPDAFDCSGLTMMAWAAGGVSLPHSSGAQMGSGTPVSVSALQPGDLVFYYSPVSHVGIYVGNGQIVHAANPGTGVQMTSVGSMPISGAVRPG